MFLLEIGRLDSSGSATLQDRHPEQIIKLTKHLELKKNDIPRMMYTTDMTWYNPCIQYITHKISQGAIDKTSHIP